MQEKTTHLAPSVIQDDFSRKVYCLLGVPIDDIGMGALVDRVFNAAKSRSRLFISTPNLNFVMLGQHDPAFRRSLLESDICPVDGIGVLLLCRLLGIPITSRVAGSDLPAAIQGSTDNSSTGPIRIAFMGGEPGVGELASSAVNAGNKQRLMCVGAIDPGIINAQRQGDPLIVERLNGTGADFLLVALGAQKGQAWLLRNMDALKIPVVSHLGATLNFLAGTIRRAPVGVRRVGLEWLWRIWEEPKLAPRYMNDGSRLLWILLTRIAPLGFWLFWNRSRRSRQHLSASVDDGAGQTTISVAGEAYDEQLATSVTAFRSAVGKSCQIVLDLSGLTAFETGFAGQILMLEKSAMRQGMPLAITGASPSVMRALCWCGLGHLIVR